MRTVALLLALLALPVVGGGGRTAAAAEGEVGVAKVIAVRAGHHPTYDRVVIEFDRVTAMTRIPSTVAGAIVVDVAARAENPPALPENVTRIRSVFFENLVDGTRIRIRGAGPLRAFRLDDPPRLIVDFGDDAVAPFEPPEGTRPLGEALRKARTQQPPWKSAPGSVLSPPLAEVPGKGVPPCANSCPEFAQTGELRAGVAITECTRVVCQQEARRLYAKGEFPEALAALEHISDGRTGMPGYELDLGLVLYALRRFEEAVVAFDRVLEKFPTNMDAGVQKGHALGRLGRLEEARAQFEKLLDLPGVAEQYKEIRTSSYLAATIGVILLREGKIQEGKAELQRALDGDTNNPLAPTMLNSVVPALEAGSLDPEAIGELQLADEEVANGRHDRAVAGFESVVSRWPRFETTWQVLAEIHISRLDYAACEDVYRRAARNIPSSTDFRIERLRCRILRYGAGTDEGRAAIADLQTLANDHPENRRVRDLLSDLGL